MQLIGGAASIGSRRHRQASFEVRIVYGDGRLRATIASVPDKGRMTGILLSLHNPRGAAFAPAAAPIAFLKRDQIAGEELGNFKPGQGPYNSYLEILRQASADVVFALPT